MTRLETDLLEFRQRSTRERVDLISRVADAWYGPPAQLGSPDIPEDLPEALRLFYARLGASLETICRQNALLLPSELRGWDGLIVIATENQGVYTWGTRAISNDPPVFGRFQGAESWTQEESCVSEFLLGFVLLEAIFAAPRGASAASLDAPEVAEVLDQMTPVDLPPWRWPAHPGRFFSRGNALAFCCPNAEDSSSLWVGGKQAQDVAFLKSLVRPSWEHVAL